MRGLRSRSRDSGSAPGVFRAGASPATADCQQLPTAADTNTQRLCTREARTRSPWTQAPLPPYSSAQLTPTRRASSAPSIVYRPCVVRRAVCALPRALDGQRRPSTSPIFCLSADGGLGARST